MVKSKGGQTTKIAAEVENIFKVPKAQWRKWSVMQQCMFNQLYAMMQNNKLPFHHPKADEVQDAHWGTTCWNAAWTAADLMGRPQ